MSPPHTGSDTSWGGHGAGGTSRVSGRVRNAAGKPRGTQREPRVYGGHPLGAALWKPCPPAGCPQTSSSQGQPPSLYSTVLHRHLSSQGVPPGMFPLVGLVFQGKTRYSKPALVDTAASGIPPSATSCRITGNILSKPLGTRAEPTKNHPALLFGVEGLKNKHLWDQLHLEHMAQLGSPLWC